MFLSNYAHIQVRIFSWRLFLFFEHIFIESLGISYHRPISQSSHTHPFVIPLHNKQQPEKAQFSLSMYSLTCGQTLSGLPLPHSYQRPQLWRATIKHPHHTPVASHLGCYFREGVYGLSQEPSISLFLNCEFEVIDITAKVASLFFTVSGAAQIMSFRLISANSMGHEHTS